MAENACRSHSHVAIDQHTAVAFDEDGWAPVQRVDQAPYLRWLLGAQLQRELEVVKRDPACFIALLVHVVDSAAAARRGSPGRTSREGLCEGRCSRGE